MHAIQHVRQYDNWLPKVFWKNFSEDSIVVVGVISFKHTGIC